jgi:hypothetical protein
VARRLKPASNPLRRNEDLIERSLDQIATILLRAGFDSPAAERLLRRSFILAATKMASVGSRRATQSQIASLAGVSRLEARKLGGKIPSAEHSTPSSRFEALIRGWKTDSRFSSRASTPRPLKFSGADSEFDSLVKKYGRDITKKTLREQLVKLGFDKERSGRLFLIRDTPAVERSTAAWADLKFVLSQLGNIDFELGRRAYSSKRISISTRDKKSVQAMRRMASTRLETVLNSLKSLSEEKHQRKAGWASHRLLVSTTVAVESEEK